MAKPSRDRTIILSDSISQKSVTDVIKSIVDINNNDGIKTADYKKFKRRPIQLILNTNGGSVYDGLGLISVIEQSKTPVHITVMGRAMSMGLFILVVGDKRVISKYSTVMYHQISTYARDKLQGIKNDIKEAERLERVCEAILFKRSKITPEHLEPYKREKGEWYISPKQALKLGIVDKVI